MLKKMLYRFALLVLLTGLTPLSANVNVINKSAVINTHYLPDFSTDNLFINGLAIKRGEPYDEKKDPALRKGTENEEMEQGSFFAIPAFVFGIALVFLYFNRD